jgi:hypothetical protein
MLKKTIKTEHLLRVRYRTYWQHVFFNTHKKCPMVSDSGRARNLLSSRIRIRYPVPVGSVSFFRIRDSIHNKLCNFFA